MGAAELTPASATTEPKIVRREKFLVMGMLTRIEPGTETGEKFAAIWSELEAHRGRIQPHSTDQKYYGISFATTDEAGFEYLAGMAIMPVQKIPAGLVVREVPAATYAVFACQVKAIGQTKRHIFGEWRSKSGREIDNSAPVFEQYPSAEDTGSPVLIHIPIWEAKAK
jgi:AraC family transcriptional regulator